VLDRHADPRGNIHAIQLEIDRAAYLDLRLVERGEGFAGVVDVLTRVVRDLACDVAAMGARGWPPAPAVGPKPPNKPFPEAIKNHLVSFDTRWPRFREEVHGVHQSCHAMREARQNDPIICPAAEAGKGPWR
jgi:hypothetical protein